MKALVIRFSSFGDVALTVPVVRGVLKENPDLSITFVSDKSYSALFHDISRCKFYGISLDQYKGAPGLFRLFKELKNHDQWDLVIDLHSVLRSWILGTLFRTSGHRVFQIDKGRKEKGVLTRKNNKQLRRLIHTKDRYLATFNEAGLSGSLNSGVSIHPNQAYKSEVDSFLRSHGLKKHEPWIAVAPFSKHKEKEWALEKMEILIAKLVSKGNMIFLFGAGSKEEKTLTQYEQNYDHVYNLAGRLSMEEEIVLLEYIDVMISMDSFNMHLAAQSQVKVVSIWGATHHFAGFGPGKENEDYIVEVSPEKLTCRPCSVFGSKPCFRKDLACLNQIRVEDVMSKVELALSAR